MKTLTLTAVLAGLAASAAAAPSVMLVSDAGSAADRALARAIEKRLPEATARRVEFDPDAIADPIAKGRLLASLQNAPIVVTVGDAAIDFVAREVEETPVYFVGAALVRGSDLALENVSGTLAYSPEDLLDAMPASWHGGVDVLYTPGYERVAEEIRVAAQARGTTTRGALVPDLKRLTAAVQKLAGESRALWIVGDPLLARGAGFQYLVEVSLSRDIALIGSEESEVREGAVLSSRGSPDALADRAARDIQRLRSGKALSPRISTAPPGGSIVFQPALARKFGLATDSAGWRPVP